MPLVVDANVVISALIDDSKTPELVATLEPDLLAPQFVHDETEKVVPTNELYPHIDEAREAISETDPDDVLYVATALAEDADIWSDDSDFDEQNVVGVYSTSDVIDSYETR